MKAIVLAGGGGTRLWPLSREDFPKQFLNFGTELSLLQRSVQRLLHASFIDEIMVATNTHHLELVQEQLQKIGANSRVKIIVEPSRKNTAPAIGLSVKYLEQYCHAQQLDTVIVLPSDHFIEPESLFLHAIEQMEAIAQTKNIITFGIRPTKPETGYGYIQIGRKFDGLTFKVSRFIEKPNQSTAEKYLGDPHFYWNAGIFIFSIDTFWKQLQNYSPQLHLLFSGSYEESFEKFEKMPSISIDYALLEKSKEILVCPLAVSWSDVGCWDSVYEVMDKDSDQNVRMGQVFAVDTINSLIIGSNRLISTIGLNDILIVDTEDALFVSKKGESQRVKGLVEQLMQKGRKESVLHKIQIHSWGASHLLCESEEYNIQKIQIFSGKKFEYQQDIGVEVDWIALKGNIHSVQDANKWIFSNLHENTIEFLWIEKKLGASCSS